MNSDSVEVLLQDIFKHGYEFAEEFPGEDISKVTDSCVAQHKAALLALLEAEAVDFFEPDEELDNILVQTRAVPLSKVRELFDV